jgi:hypothetical protein
MSGASKVTERERRQMIAEAAYFRAEKRGFGGDPVADWIEAEAEVDRKLGETENGLSIERIEEGLAAATKRLAAIKKRATGLASETRTELGRDVDRLRELRDTLRVKVKEIREGSEHTGQKAFRQAEKAWNELAETMQRLAAKASH